MATNDKSWRPIRESEFWRAYEGVRYTLLFYALLLTLIVSPIIITLGMPALLLRLLLCICLFAAILPSTTKRTRLALSGGAMLLILARLAPDYGYLQLQAGLILAVVGVVGLAAAASALRFSITSTTLNSETIYAALSTYLLAGLFFGQIYWSIESLHPGSFAGPDGFSEAIAIYYSFVTLATLGYGDVLPRTDIARGVAIFEVMGGQLFLAVMVARLIGAFGDWTRES